MERRGEAVGDELIRKLDEMVLADGVPVIGVDPCYGAGMRFRWYQVLETSRLMSAYGQNVSVGIAIALEREHEFLLASKTSHSFTCTWPQHARVI